MSDLHAVDQMKLQAKISDEITNLEIHRDGDNVTARVGDREYQLEVNDIDRGLYLLKNNGCVYEVFVSAGPANAPAKVSIRNHSFDVEVIDPRSLSRTASDHAHGDGQALIKTAMPGKVVRILVQAGDSLAEGDGVIVVEAMKMQNEMRSPKDGIVKEIRVDEGATVNAGDVLVVIE